MDLLSHYKKKKPDKCIKYIKLFSESGKQVIQIYDPKEKGHKGDEPHNHLGFLPEKNFWTVAIVEEPKQNPVASLSWEDREWCSGEQRQLEFARHNTKGRELGRKTALRNLHISFFKPLAKLYMHRIKLSRGQTKKTTVKKQNKIKHLTV